MADRSQKRPCVKEVIDVQEFTDPFHLESDLQLGHLHLPQQFFVHQLFLQTMRSTIPV